MTHQQIKNCVDACIACATTCNYCAVSSLEEDKVQHLTKCIRLDLECAAICITAAELMSVESPFSKELCHLCATICNACAEECEKHAAMGMEHCKECAEVCRTCAKETMEIYKKLETQEQLTKDNKWLVTQEECAIISRATATLISLKSSYATQLSEINTNICRTAVEDLQDHVAMEMEHCNACASVAKEVHQNLTGQDNSSGKNKPAVVDKTQQTSKKHSFALLAASVWRSPSQNARSHVNYDIRGKRSRLTNTGTWFTP